MMFRYPGLFKAGIAVAPVADQRHYDTIYQERYMGLPEQNAKGYHDGSPISFADGLNAKLLVIHGSGDDNVHFQGTELLINRLVELGKPFDMMDYPNRTHSISEGAGHFLPHTQPDRSIPGRECSGRRSQSLGFSGFLTQIPQRKDLGI